MDDCRDPFQCVQTTDLALRPSGRPRRSCSLVKKSYVDYNEKLHGKDPWFGFLPRCPTSTAVTRRKAKSAGSVAGVIDPAAGTLRSDQHQSETVPSTCGKTRESAPEHGGTMQQPSLSVAVNDPHSIKYDIPPPHIQGTSDGDGPSSVQPQLMVQHESIPKETTPETFVRQHREAASPRISSESTLLPAADDATNQQPVDSLTVTPCVMSTPPQAAVVNERVTAKTSATLSSIARLDVEESSAAGTGDLVPDPDPLPSLSVTAAAGMRQPSEEVQSPGSHRKREDAKKRTRKRNLLNKERKLRKKQQKLRKQSLSAAPKTFDIKEQQFAKSGADKSDPTHGVSCDNDSSTAATIPTARAVPLAAINPAMQPKKQAKKAKPLHPGCTWQPSWQSPNRL